MPSLLELQQAFREAVFRPEHGETALLPWLLEGKEVGRQRLKAYRRSIISRLIDTLEASYPVLNQLVGRPFLREAARQYALITPSASGDLNDYGESFADFLASYPHAVDLPYLPDVARLEWRVQAVAVGPDNPLPDLAALASLAPEDWSNLRFKLAPSHARLNSSWAVGDIWRMHQSEAGEAPTELVTPCHILVRRAGTAVVVEDLTPGAACLLDGLAAGLSLGDGLEQAAALDPEFDPAVLRAFVARGLLVAAEIGTLQAWEAG